MLAWRLEIRDWRLSVLNLQSLISISKTVFDALIQHNSGLIHLVCQTFLSIFSFLFTAKNGRREFGGNMPCSHTV